MTMDLGAFSPLPNEAITLIFRHVPSARDVCALASTARLFYSLGNDQSIWRDLCTKYFKDEIEASNKHASEFEKDWIWLYKSKVELKGTHGVGKKKVKNQGMLQGTWVNDMLEGYLPLQTKCYESSSHDCADTECRL